MQSGARSLPNAGPQLCGGCNDGFAAALASHMWLQSNAPDKKVGFIHGSFDKNPPDVTGRNVVIFDFSYKAPIYEQMIKNAKSISYTVSMNDSIIKIPRYFTIKDNLKWRQQQLKVQIKVPEGSELIYSKNAREFLDKMN